LNKVKAKKHLGQHFLLDMDIAQRIVDSIPQKDTKTGLLEIGPGMGVLTQFMVKRPDLDIYLVEIDQESVDYLNVHFEIPTERILKADFLHMNLLELFEGYDRFSIIGNFPYNISSQIFFKVLEQYNRVEQVTCMLQKEVGRRIASKPGNKDYGILSVLLQAFYDISYDFSIGPHVFDPPPAVDSCVITLVRNPEKQLSVPFEKFKLVVKTAFNQRRKMLSNALAPILQNKVIPYANKRAEQLGYEQFIELTAIIFS
jgi:16S rRNA (adenine1518-N6/adenine1519-N6)-dimethyltransferase